MVSIFQPRFPTQPSPAGATVATTQFPTELAPFIKDILEKAKAQQVGAAYQPYTGPQLAQFTDAEKAAMDAMRQQTTGLAGTDVAQATPYFTGAKTATEGLGQQFTGDVAQQFMNPYQQAVVDQAKRKAIEDYEQVTAPKITAQAIAQQPFGGSRQAIAEGMAREGLADRLSEMQERGLASAYASGQKAFEQQKARELQQAQQLAQLGQTVPQQALRDLAVQQQLGAEERQQEQLALDLSKGQFMEEREFPTRALQEYSAIVRGFPFQPSTYQTSTQYQPTPSIANQLLQLGGVGMGAYTQFTGKPMANLFGMGGAAKGGGIADVISNQMGKNMQMRSLGDFTEAASELELQKKAQQRELEELARKDLQIQAEAVALDDPEEPLEFLVSPDDEEFVPGFMGYNVREISMDADRLNDAQFEEKYGETKTFMIGNINELGSGRALQRIDEKRLGGLPTIYNAEAENEQNQEITDLKNTTIGGDAYTIDTTGLKNKITTEAVAPSEIDLEGEYKDLFQTMTGNQNFLNRNLKESVPEAAKILKYVEDLKEPEDYAAYKAVMDDESTVGKAFQQKQEKLQEVLDPTSEFNIERDKTRLAQRATAEGRGMVEAALAMDPSQSFVQNFSTLLGGTATGYGAARDAFDSYVEQDMNEQIQANQGIVDLQSDRIKLQNETKDRILAEQSNVLQAKLATLGKLIENKNIDSGMIGNLLGLQAEIKLKLLERQQQDKTTALSAEELNLKRTEILNNIENAKFLAKQEAWKNMITHKYNIADLVNKQDEIAAIVQKAEIEAGIDRNNLDTEFKNTLASLDRAFQVSTDADGQLTFGKMNNPRDSMVYMLAQSDIMRRISWNKANNRPAYEGIGELTSDYMGTKEHGIVPGAFKYLDENILASDVGKNIRDDWSSYNGTMRNWITTLQQDPDKYKLSQIVKGNTPEDKDENFKKFMDAIANNTIIL